MRKHHYKTTTEWTGNQDTGTSDYRKYSRSHSIKAEGKSSEIEGSSDSSFRGDATRYNPEELLVSSLSACHMLWYLHLCAAHGIVVTDYVDEATGVMEETTDGSGRFREVTLHPIVTITEAVKKEQAHQLHQEASRMCFIANSCNFPIKHEAEVRTA